MENERPRTQLSFGISEGKRQCGGAVEEALCAVSVVPIKTVRTVAAHCMANTRALRTELLESSEALTPASFDCSF